MFKFAGKKKYTFIRKFGGIFGTFLTGFVIKLDLQPALSHLPSCGKQKYVCITVLLINLCIFKNKIRKS